MHPEGRLTGQIDERFRVSKNKFQLVSKFHTALHAAVVALTKPSDFRLKATNPIQNSSSTKSLVSLCLKANAEMVPKIPSCHYMLLM